MSASNFAKAKASSNNNNASANRMMPGGLSLAKKSLAKQDPSIEIINPQDNPAGAVVVRLTEH